MQLSRASKDLTSGDPKLEQLLCGTLETILTTCVEPRREQDCHSVQEKEQMWAFMEKTYKTWLVEVVMDTWFPEVAEDLGGNGKVELLEAAERCEVNKYYKGSVIKHVSKSIILSSVNSGKRSQSGAWSVEARSQAQIFMSPTSVLPPGTRSR